MDTCRRVRKYRSGKKVQEMGVGVREERQGTEQIWRTTDICICGRVRKGRFGREVKAGEREGRHGDKVGER